MVTGANTALSEGFNAVIQKIEPDPRGSRNWDRFREPIYFHLGGIDLYLDSLRARLPTRIGDEPVSRSPAVNLRVPFRAEFALLVFPVIASAPAPPMPLHFRANACVTRSMSPTHRYRSARSRTTNDLYHTQARLKPKLFLQDRMGAQASGDKISERHPTSGQLSTD